MAFDLTTYLERVGRPADLASPTADALVRLHYAHATSIPFENLDIHLGRPIRIDLASVAAKLVDGGRGGYCFEHNTLFAAALEALGFEVTRLAARVLMGGPGVTRPRTHMLLRVAADGADWLSDVGFGGATPLGPVPLAPGEEIRFGDWTYRLGHDESLWTLQLRQEKGWLDLYEFTEEPQLPEDYEMANYFTSTHPSSGFVQAITAQAPGPQLQVVLRGRELAEHRPDGVTTRPIQSDDDLLQVLSTRFGLVFPAGTRFTAPTG